MFFYCRCGRVKIDNQWFEREEIPQEEVLKDPDFPRKHSFTMEHIHVYPHLCDACRPCQAEPAGSSEQVTLSASSGD